MPLITCISARLSHSSKALRSINLAKEPLGILLVVMMLVITGWSCHKTVLLKANFLKDIRTLWYLLLTCMTLSFGRIPSTQLLVRFHPSIPDNLLYVKQANGIGKRFLVLVAVAKSPCPSRCAIMNSGSGTLTNCIPEIPGQETHYGRVPERIVWK